VSSRVTQCVAHLCEVMYWRWDNPGARAHRRVSAIRESRMHMKSIFVRAAYVMALGAIVACGDAVAWGDRGQQSISLMAMQVVKDQFPNAFRAGGTSYEKDCLRGAAEGVAALGGKVPLGSDAEALQAVGTEIQLLHEISEFGTGSYFAYRMGVLSALVANVMTPYGLAFSPEDEAVQRKLFADIDKHLNGYAYSPAKNYRERITDPLSYFKKKRSFIGDDRRLVGEDYRSGRGYNGFMKEGGPAYFVRCVEAVADAWTTVYSDAKQPPLAEASRRMQTWYFVDEINYLLLEKKNVKAAENAFENFHKVVQNDPEAYEAIGDSFAEYGGEVGTERAVREWQNAHAMAGQNRNDVAVKLNTHYLGVGNGFLDKAARPGADDNDLPSALRAFESALEFDRRSVEAADLIQKTHVLINERNARHDTALKILASADTLRTQADGLASADDFGGAIKTYRQSMSFYGSVGDEFKEETRKGKDGVRNVKSAINSTISKILSRGSDAVDAGEKAEEEKRFEDAISSYGKVEGIVAAIPDENITGNKQHAAQKLDMIELAKQKIEEAKRNKMKYEEQQRQAAEAAKKGGKKAAAPGAPPAAPAPAP